MFNHVGSAVVEPIYHVIQLCAAIYQSMHFLHVNYLFVFLQDRPWSRSLIDYVFKTAINFQVIKVFEKFELLLRNFLNQVFIYNFYY